MKEPSALRGSDAGSSSAKRPASSWAVLRNRNHAFESRGRISAVNAMFAFGGPQLGQLESGVVVSLTSPQFSVVSGGVACILATLVIVAFVPGLLRLKEGIS